MNIGRSGTGAAYLRLTKCEGGGDSEPSWRSTRKSDGLFSSWARNARRDGWPGNAPRVKAAWPGARVAAPAVPVTCAPGDNLAIHVAVARAAEGSVLVADVGDVNDRGYWGEVLTTGAESCGLRGLVIDGCVRDVDALRHTGSRSSRRGSRERGDREPPGSVGLPSMVGGVLVSPGDWVIADRERGDCRSRRIARRCHRGRARPRPK